MASLFTKVKLYLEDNSKTENEIIDGNVILQNDGSGDFIKSWNVDGVSKPTDSQLNSYDADKEETNNSIRETRKEAYGNIGDQLDEIFKDMDAWKARIQKIKNDNPKE